MFLLVYSEKVLELLRKVFLTGVIIFIRPETSTQLAFGCLIALTFTVLYSEYKPYLYGEDDLLQLLCQLAIFCTMFSGLLIKARVNEEDGFDSTAFAGLLVAINVFPICVAITRVGFIMKMVLGRILAKRHIIEELSHKGEVKNVLQTPKFPVIDENTLAEKTAEEQSAHESSNSEEPAPSRQKKHWCSWKKPKKTTTGVTSMASLQSELEDIVATGGSAQSGSGQQQGSGKQLVQARAHQAEV